MTSTGIEQDYSCLTDTPMQFCFIVPVRVSSELHILARKAEKGVANMCMQTTLEYTSKTELCFAYDFFPQKDFWGSFVADNLFDSDNLFGSETDQQAQNCRHRSH